VTGRASVAAGRFVGQSVPRKEDPRLLTGRGTYVDDIVIPGMLHAAFVRSPVARARIRRLDVEAARAADGVRAVFTAAEFAGHWHDLWSSIAGPDSPQPPLRLLADGDVRFVGDLVALVVAEDPYLAEDACDLVELDLDVLTPVIDYEQAAADTENLVHPELGTNVAMVIPQLLLAPDAPELEDVFRTAPHVFTETIRQHRSTNVPMEPRGIVSSWDPYARQLQIHSSTQNPHEVRAVCARMLRIPEHDIRAVMPDVGGGFGQKGMPSRDELTIVMASVLLGRTVKWIEDRRENLVAANSARCEQATVRMAFDADGRILAASMDYLDDVGAYPLGGTGSTGGMVGFVFPGPYHMPLFGHRATTVYTNTCGRAPYRGPWQMESVAREVMMDIAARGMGIDPLELRRRNVIHGAEMPFTTANGVVYEDVSPADTLEQAAELIGYDAFRAEQEQARRDGRHIGIGIGLYVEPNGFAFSEGGFSSEAATVRVEPTGKVTVSMGCASHGQGLETTVPQVAADHLGVHVDDVVLVQGDTAVVPFGGGTGGSRSAVLLSGAVGEACNRARQKIVEIAAHVMEAAPGDLDVHHGVVVMKGTPARSVTVAEVARIAYLDPDRLPPDLEPGLEVSARVRPRSIQTHSNSCHMAICEVDARTARPTVHRFVVSEDCGVVINPMIVEGQIAGGVVQGLGGVFYEHMSYDDAGNPQATTFMDYLLPSAHDVPVIEYGHLETPAHSNPGGHKGMGEGGAIGSVPALINAVGDALAPLGVVVKDQPLGPRQIFELLHGR
jgi:carbon-monoxide dehydrogenase large subunit